MVAMQVPQYRSPVFDSLLTEIPWAGRWHVVPGSMALVLGGLLLSSRIRRHYLPAHRWLGRLYVFCVLASSFGAFVGNFASPSGTAARLAFLASGILWPLVTLAATPLSDHFDRRSHGRLMTVSYALTFSAVTLRIYLSGLLASGLDFSLAYAIAAWASWTGNLAFVLLLFRFRDQRRAAEIDRLMNSGSAIL